MRVFTDIVNVELMLQKKAATISEELEAVMYAIDENKVPVMWSFTYKSTKFLMAWLNDFSRRMDQFKRWQ